MAKSITENKETLMRPRAGISKFQEARYSIGVLSISQHLVIKGNTNYRTTNKLMIFSVGGKWWQNEAEGSPDGRKATTTLKKGSQNTMRNFLNCTISCMYFVLS